MSLLIIVHQYVICAQQDSCIKVIHKENGGLSDARNVGSDIVTGEYITFVDSDDYIHDEMAKKLYENIVKNNSYIAIYNRFSIYDNGEQDLYNKESVCIIGTNSIEKFCIMFQKGWEALAKLYKISLFNILRYLKGMLYEDFALTPKLFVNSNIVSYIPDGLYFYRIRSDSIMRKSP